jgi:hypothetical protein
MYVPLGCVSGNCFSPPQWTWYKDSAPMPPNSPLVISKPQDSALALSWKVPSGNGLPVTSYNISCATASNPGKLVNFVILPATKNAQENDIVALTLPGLTNGVSYVVMVFAINNAGASTPGEPMSGLTPSKSTGLLFAGVIGGLVVVGILVCVVRKMRSQRGSLNSTSQTQLTPPNGYAPLGPADDIDEGNSQARVPSQVAPVPVGTGPVDEDDVAKRLAMLRGSTRA